MDAAATATDSTAPDATAVRPRAWQLALAAAALLLAGALHVVAAAEATLEAQRAQFAKALDLAERGPESAARSAAAALAGHPLAAYLEYALLRRDLAGAPAASLRAFLQRHDGSPVASLLREEWLAALARRGDWATYRAVAPQRALGELSPERRCAMLRARLAAGVDAALLDAIESTWLSGTSMPALCDPAFAALEDAGRITRALTWKRVALAVDFGNAGLLRYLAAGLPAADAAQVRGWADFLAAPGTAALRGRAQPLARTVAVTGLSRLAQRDPDAAARLLAQLSKPLALDAAQRGAVLNAVALWAAASYLPDAARRFAAVPPAAWDARLHEWQVREALARGADADALAALAAMPAAQRNDGRWRYLEARLRARGGEGAAAQALLEPLAREANYHGFLAADRLGQPYALCPRELDPVPELRARIAGNAPLLRALELFALDRAGWATREWHAAMEDADPPQRRAAVALAVDAGWYDRAVFALDGEEELAFYSLRFPFDHAEHLRRAAAQRGLDPAWVAALIRAESVWMAEARSPANARGLMQLVPATGKALARELGVRWGGAATLYQPLTNITLGTAYLRAMLDRFGGEPVVATAAYNAGPTPATRWRDERARADADLWIETIPYRETRDYVARVFAFSVIYDWRLNGDALPLSARLAGNAADADIERRGFACPDSGKLIVSRP